MLFKEFDGVERFAVMDTRRDEMSASLGAAHVRRINREDSRAALL